MEEYGDHTLSLEKRLIQWESRYNCVTTPIRLSSLPDEPTPYSNIWVEHNKRLRLSFYRPNDDIPLEWKASDKSYIDVINAMAALQDDLQVQIKSFRENMIDFNPSDFSSIRQYPAEIVFGHVVAEYHHVRIWFKRLEKIAEEGLNGCGKKSHKAHWHIRHLGVDTILSERSTDFLCREEHIKFRKAYESFSADTGKPLLRWKCSSVPACIASIKSIITGDNKSIRVITKEDEIRICNQLGTYLKNKVTLNLNSDACELLNETQCLFKEGVDFTKKQHFIVKLFEAIDYIEKKYIGSGSIDITAMEDRNSTIKTFAIIACSVSKTTKKPLIAEERERIIIKLESYFRGRIYYHNDHDLLNDTIQDLRKGNEPAEVVHSSVELIDALPLVDMVFKANLRARHTYEYYGHFKIKQFAPIACNMLLKL